MFVNWHYDFSRKTLVISDTPALPRFNELVPLSKGGTIGKKALHSVLPWAEHIEDIVAIEAPDTIEVTPLAFAWLPNLETAHLPAARIIDNGAFIGCEKLRLIEAPSVLVLGHSAFSGCHALVSSGEEKEKIIMRKLKYVSCRAFYNCKSLKSVTFAHKTSDGQSDGSELVFMDTAAFFGCSSLKTVSLAGKSCRALFAPKPFILCPNLSTKFFPQRALKALEAEIDWRFDDDDEEDVQA